MRKRWSRKLVRMGACGEAVEWAETQPSMKTAWRTCERGDWMVWLLRKTDQPKILWVQLAVAFARFVLHHVPEGESRPRLAIEAAEAWIHNPTDAAADAEREKQANMVRELHPNPPKFKMSA